MPETSTLSITTRLWFAWVCFFRILFDSAFAGRVWRAREAALGLAAPSESSPELPSATSVDKPDASAPRRDVPPATVAPSGDPAPSAPNITSALQLLALLQREGRLIDFLEQDIEPFSDAEIGAAVRVVHAGCRKAIRGHATIEPLRGEDEGVSITLNAGFNPLEVKLSGNVQGSAPYRGVLRHRGWRAKNAVLPTPVAGHDPTILAPAEVEL